MWRALRAAFLGMLLGRLIACNALASFNNHTVSEVSDRIHFNMSRRPDAMVKRCSQHRSLPGNPTCSTAACLVRNARWPLPKCALLVGSTTSATRISRTMEARTPAPSSYGPSLSCPSYDPHPGPTTNTTPTTSPTAGPKPLRVNSSAGAICLYEVYAHLSRMLKNIFRTRPIHLGTCRIVPSLLCNG